MKLSANRIEQSRPGAPAWRKSRRLSAAGKARACERRICLSRLSVTRTGSGSWYPECWEKPPGKAGTISPASRRMAEFVIKLADERGRVQEQVQTAATAEELRARFTHAGYHVFTVRARGGFGGLKRGKVKLEPFLIFNQQFLTLVSAGLPILGSLQMLAKIQKNAHFASPAGRRGQPRQNRRLALCGLRGAERLSGHVHHHAAGRRALRQPAGGAGALCELPEGLAHLPQKADRLADLSGAAADPGDRPDDLSAGCGGAAVCRAL